MLTAGVIAEFNPYHNGHSFLLKRLRESGATHIAVAMSGNFVQRGDAAVLSKWARTRQALLCGADLVAEIPLPWAAAGAEKFAFGGVSLLNALGADVIGFASECGSLEKLQNASEALGSPELRVVLKSALEEGKTFAAARQYAVEKLFGSGTAGILSHPNNILGIEYLKALQKVGSAMVPYTVRRAGAAHDSEIVGHSFASSSQIRSLLRKGEDCSTLIPEPAGEILRAELLDGKAPAGLERMERAVLAKLRVMQRAEYSDLPDLSEGLENRVFAAARKASSLTELYSLIKTKRYPLARIRRVILAAFLGIKSTYSGGVPPYLRILGMGPKGPDILRGAKRQAALPILTRSSDFPLLQGKAAKIMELENRATDLYALCMPKPSPCGLDRTTGFIVC